MLGCALCVPFAYLGAVQPRPYPGGHAHRARFNDAQPNATCRHTSPHGSLHLNMSSAVHRRAVLLMLVSVASFAANVLLVRALGLVTEANSWLVSSTRFIGGLVIVATVYRREFQPVHLVRNRKLIERGLFGAVGVYLTYLCIAKLGAGRATFINNTYVIWGGLLAAWLLREKLRRVLLLGSVVTLVGLALLTNLLSATARPGFYDFAAIFAAWVAGYVVVTIRQLHHTEHSSTIFAAQCLYGLVLCAVPAAVTFSPVPPLGWLILLLAAVTAGIAQLTMTRAFRDLPVAEGALLQMLVPVGVTIGGAVFFHEHFTAQELAGAALILTGAALTTVCGGNEVPKVSTR